MAQREMFQGGETLSALIRTKTFNWCKLNSPYFPSCGPKWWVWTAPKHNTGLRLTIKNGRFWRAFLLGLVWNFLSDFFFQAEIYIFIFKKSQFLRWKWSILTSQIVWGSMWRVPRNKDFQHCESGEPWRLTASEQGKALMVPHSAPLQRSFLALPAVAELTFPGFQILL